MSYKNYIKYSHLTPEERGKIEILSQKGESISQIAKDMKRHKSTISREIRRNSDKPETSRVNRPKSLNMDARHYRGTSMVDELRASRNRFYERKANFEHSLQYNAYKAGLKAKKRRSKASNHGLLLDRLEYQPLLENFKQKYQKEKWTPEIWILHNRKKQQILEEQGQEVFEAVFDENDRTIYPDISVSAFYEYTKVHKELKKYLTHKGRRYRYKRPSTKYNDTNRDKHHIEDRPEIVKQKKRVGDLEGDTVVGKDQKDRIITHIDRVSKISCLGLQLAFDSYKVCQQAAADIVRVYGEIKTITYDNGSEFTRWRLLESKLGAIVYFADPYSPWQRGTNENLNGLIRRFIPKGTDLKKLTKSDILEIESIINNRPRKCFSGLSPLENQRLLRLAGE